MLEIKNLSVRYGDFDIVNDVSLSVMPGQWLMIVGPNGAGKSTIINAISQGAPYTGEILFDGEDISGLKPSVLAKKFGVLSQSHSVSYSFSVEEIVMLGRYAYSKSIFSSKNDSDVEKVRDALEKTGMTALKDHSVLTLSGGELQRTFLAQLIAQDPRMLILDEPTNHLDLVYQKQTFELISRWIKDTGRAVMSVVHDLNLAKAFGTHAVLLDKGRIVASGEAGEVLTAEYLNSVYMMDVYKWMTDMLSQWKQPGR